MLIMNHLSAGYSDLQVLNDVSLELAEGKISVLMGPNGAGKTTLLKSILHLTHIVSGHIFWQGEDITQLPTHERLSRGIAFVPQGKVNFGNLTVKENLELGVFQFNSLFPILKEKEKQFAYTLSGGQQQMLALARALQSSPRLLLLDEPSLGLSPKLVKEVFQKIVEIRDQFKTTILIVEHNLKSLLEVADYGYVMMQGEIVAEDTCQNLKKSEIMKQVFVGKWE